MDTQKILNILERIEPEGFNWTGCTDQEMVKFKAIAESFFRAGMQKVLDWANETCPHDLGEGTQNYKMSCGLCWREIRCLDWKGR